MFANQDLLYLGLVLIFLGFILFYFNAKIAKAFYIGGKNLSKIFAHERTFKSLSYDFVLKFYKIAILGTGAILIIFGLYSILIS